jgi:hypothetical protein
VVSSAGPVEGDGVDEVTWLTCEDPQPMLDLVLGKS